MTYRTSCQLATLITVLILAISPCWGSDFRETESFAPVVEQTQAYAHQFGPERVLVVMDIDNTLLAMDSDLGSDQWFEWQEFLLDQQPDSPHLVGQNFGELLEVQGLLYAAHHMHPPEAEQPEQVQELQNLGVDTLVLTSRGDDYRAATLRELKRAGYDFAKTAPRISLFAGDADNPYETGSRFIPYNTETPAAFGLTAHEMKVFHLPDNPREVSYADGVLMTSGQHKGAMLLMFMHLVNKPYDAIIYVDDHGRHVSRVYDAMARRGLDVTTFHYTHEAARVKQFAYGDKQEVTRQWQAIDALLHGEASQPEVAEAAAP
ncbi:DUF2608 domain-containing protein [Aeoliella sp. ICT_H6.2]|uniref:DUF2608 domain-containing protein n=1 Tax=Aeoliella straminimaris TaxID=2954799 RepID=A0A9X2FFV1_9BACT|nr:DUF2608 domain-containing protein [Aeoliella straminimaris]MCO6048069.1 DUF2608 domain-containing protein [Aeoliella straminimaris]